MSLAPKYPKLVVTKILETNYTNLFLKPKRDVFLETNCFNLILIFLIRRTIINIIREEIRINSLQAKRHCVPSENNSFLLNYG